MEQNRLTPSSHSISNKLLVPAITVPRLPRLCYLFPKIASSGLPQVMRQHYTVAFERETGRGEREYHMER